MHIRCKSCHGTVWVEHLDAAGQSEPIQCKTCGQDYRVEGARWLRSGGRRLAVEARKLAEKHDIDLPGAYSVLFGTMDAEEVRELGHRESPACRTTPKALQPTETDGRIVYDRAFQPAIDAGLLTPYQAAERGQREQYAVAIANRHGLPMQVAYDVADNRTSLLNSLRGRTCDDGGGIQLNVPPSPYRVVVRLGVALSLSVLAVLLFYHASPSVREEGAQTRSVLGAEVRTDRQGRVLRVVGANPRAVLTAFCASHVGPPVEPIDVVPSARYGAGVRLGLFRESADDSNVFMIEISEDRAAGRWVAGNGAAPVVPKSVPPDALANEPAVR